MGLQQAGDQASKSFGIRIDTAFAMPAQDMARRRWPYLVRLEMPADVDVLRKAARLNGGVGNSKNSLGEPLDWWTAAEIENRIARTGEIRPGKIGPARSSRRVLYAQSPSAFTGAEQVLVSLASAISRRFDCTALIPAAGTLTDRLAQVGVEVRVAGRDFAVSSVENYLYSARRLDEINPGVIHANTVVGVPFCCAVAERGIPFVQYVHVAAEAGLLQLRDQLVWASTVIAASDFVKRCLVRLDVDPRCIHVIHYGTPYDPGKACDLTLRASSRKACDVPEHGQLVLLVARFAKNKRHDVALDAFASLLAKLSNAYLVVVGEPFTGSQLVFEAVQRRIARLDIRERVRMVGFSENMRGFYAAADAVILPSEDDPFPVTILEAMAAGVPTVAARSGGIPEMIEHGKSGLLIEPGNAEGFVAALEQVLTDGELRRNLIDGGLTRCRSEFSVSRFARRVGDLYERLLAGELVAAGDI